MVVRTIFNRFPKVENYFVVISCGLYCTAFVCCTPMFTRFSTFIHKHLLWMVVKGPMIILMNFIQTVIILYIYGLTTVVDDLHFMLGFRLPFYWQILLLVAPVIMGVMWILSLWNFYDELPSLHISVAQELVSSIVFDKTSHVFAKIPYCIILYFHKIIPVYKEERSCVEDKPSI